MKWKERLEMIFSAVAFAEENRRREAMEIGGIRQSRRSLREALEDMGAAVAFAEAREFEYAYSLAADSVSFTPSKKPDIIEFLESIGLKDAPVRYGVVNV